MDDVTCPLQYLRTQYAKTAGSKFGGLAVPSQPTCLLTGRSLPHELKYVQPWLLPVTHPLTKRGFSGEEDKSFRRKRECEGGYGNGKRKRAYGLPGGNLHGGRRGWRMRATLPG